MMLGRSIYSTNLYQVLFYNVTNMFHVCGNFHRARALVINSRRDEILALSKVTDLLKSHLTSSKYRGTSPRKKQPPPIGP